MGQYNQIVQNPMGGAPGGMGMMAGMQG